MASGMILMQPSEEVSNKIRVELNEDLNTKDQDLATIKEWLKKQPHLPDEWEDALLIAFLRGSKYSLEKCKMKLDMYFTMRTACPEFFSNRDMQRPELKFLVDKVQIVTLPVLTLEGWRVTMCRAIDETLDTNHLNDFMKFVLMIGDIRLREEILGIAGDVYVFDASILKPHHIAKVSPSTVKKFLMCVQEAYPVNLKQVHVYNTSPLVDILYNFIKPFIKKKIRDRVFFHKDVSSIFEYIPKEIIPSNFGGEADSMEKLQSAWFKKLEEYVTWFKEQEQLKANESLRPGKPTNYDELIGIDGTFRQLTID